MTKHMTVTKLIVAIDVYCRRNGVSRTAFGLAATGDGHFIARLERGTTPRLETIDKVYRYINRKRKTA